MKALNERCSYMLSRIFLACFLMVSIPAWSEQTLDNLASQLVKASFKEKDELVQKIAGLDDERTITLLSSLKNNQLFYKKKDKTLISLIRNPDDSFDATDILTGEKVAITKKREAKKVRTNNKLRSKIRGLIATINIQSGDSSVRHAAAKDFLKSPDLIELSALDQRLSQEEDRKVEDILNLVKGLKLLNSEQPMQRMYALSLLDRSLYPEVRAALNQFVEGFDDNDKKTRKKEYTLAQKKLASIETLVKANGYIENLYFGLSLGAVLLLAAIGLAITFGVMGVINMAHGEMIMLGAYTTYVVQQLMPNHIGASLFVAIPAAFLVSGLVGILIERGIIRHLYGRPLETLLATFGVSLVLQQAVRSIFSPLNREVATPDWMAGTFMINPSLELTFNRLYIIIFSLLVLVALVLVLKRTLFGLQMRAVTMNRSMASSMGIRTGWIDALTFGLGSGIAGIAGVALSQLTNVGPNLGQAYIIDSFMVVVFGGVGNVWGTLVGAMSLGVANKMFEPLAGAVLAKILVLVFIILFIQKRPRGLFALKGRAVDNG